MRAEDRVTIRGAYYREPSTRVIQPVVEITKDLPNGFDINVALSGRHHHLRLRRRTEPRSTASSPRSATRSGSVVGKTWDRTRATLSYKYSAESDYWSHAFWASLSQHLLGQHGDGRRFRRVQPGLGRIPHAHADLPARRDGFFLPARLRFGGLGYTQVLSPVAIAQINLDAAYLNGFLANPYRQVADIGYEVFPDQRLRTAVSVRAARTIFRRSRPGLQVQYRYYRDFYPARFRRA